MFRSRFLRLLPSCGRVKISPLTVQEFRLLCSESGKNDTDAASSPTELSGQYIPRRIKKRLKDKGLSIEDLEYRSGGNPTRTFIEQAIDDPIIDKTIEIDFPSDMENLKQQNKRQQERFAHRPTGVDPAETSILLFPGQGSQFVGMGKKLLKYPGVEEMYNKASEILGYDLLGLCINGPKETLDKTIHCQPAIMVTSLAAVEKMKEEYPKALETCVGMAGFSVGEFTALVHDGVISFDDGVQAIKLRAQAMQAASEIVPSGMLTVFCDYQTKLRTALVAAREYCRSKCDIDDPICEVANFLCTEVKVVAGHEEALEFLQKYGREWGIHKTKRLPVSGAFHTRLMYHRNRIHKFWDFLDNITMNESKHKIHNNRDGKPYFMDPKKKEQQMRFLLQKQLLRPVAWEQTMHVLYTRGDAVSFPNTYEVGPGRQLGYLLRNTNRRAYDHYKNIEC